MLTSRSRIFEHVHTVASFCGDVGAEVKYDSNLNTIHVITAVGNQYNVYSLSNLAKLYASDLLPSKITCLAVQDYTIACVCDQTVHICVRGKIVATYREHSVPILGIFFMGDYILTWDVDSEVHIFHKVTCDCYSMLILQQPNFSVSAILHPYTYLNKILVASHSGELQLWNVKTVRRVHEFKKWTLDGSGITCVRQSPVVDVVAIGYNCGTILVCNIRTESLILKFNQNNARINHLSFRLDDAPVMIASSEDGFVGCWNLNEKNLESMTQLVDNPDYHLTSMQCIKAQSLMITSCTSNSLRVWIFDSKDGCAPRLLIERFGHAKGSITKVRFYGGSQTLLSVGLDGSVKKLSLVHERHNRNLGRSRITQGKANSKVKTIDADLIFLGATSAVSCESRRETDWDSAVTCHADSEIVCSWNIFKSTIGSYRLKPLPGQGKDLIHFVATCVHLTSCGNFCVIGYNDGSVNKFNIQSGQHRGSIETTYTSNNQPAPCSGIAVDNLNTKLVVCRLSKIIFYNFEKLKTLGVALEVSEDVEMMRLHCESSLLAVALIDFTVEIVDYIAQSRVRIFNDSALSCHSAKILDIAFSPDCKWLVTASLDCTIRVWNLSTRSLIDCFSTENPPVSIDFSPTADVIVVAFLESVGVVVLSNISLYRPVDLSPLPANFQPVPLLKWSETESSERNLEDDFSKELESKFNDLLHGTKSLSLTREGISKWQNLLKYDVIKEKNKPREPPKVLKLAPFFIPTVAGIDFQLDTAEAKKLLARENKDVVEKSKILHDNFSVLAKLLCEKTYDFHSVLNFLEKKSVASVDFEVYSLGHPQEYVSLDLLTKMFSILRDALRKQTHLDTAHAVLQILLKHHGPIIMNHLSAFEPVLTEIKDSHASSWSELSQTMQMCSAVASFLRSPLV